MVFYVIDFIITKINYSSILISKFKPNRTDVQRVGVFWLQIISTFAVIRYLDSFVILTGKESESDDRD